MQNKVFNFIKKNNLIPDGEKILVALSGGVDSMSLLYILNSLGYEVVVAHVNHKKRLDSEMEEEAIINLCKKLNIICEVLHLEHLDGNFQSKAHTRRYEFFRQIAKKYNIKYLATAHHADDNIETILLNIMSGSNIYGYGGISMKLELDDITIIRPFLCLSKAEIKNYASKNNIKYYEDYTNQEDDYKRNRLRHHVIPILKEECPNILNKITSYSSQLHSSFEYTRAISIDYLNKNKDTIDIDSFNNLHSYIKYDILCLLLEKYNIERSLNLIEDLIDVCTSLKPQIEYNLKNNLIFKKVYDKAFITNNIKSNNYEYILNNDSDIAENENFIFYFSKTLTKDYTYYIKLCYNKIAFPLTIRNKKDGDEIHMSYGHKKVKDLFIDKKITKEERERIPLVIDSNNSILWVVNYAKNKEVFDQLQTGNIYLLVKEKKHD